MGSECVWVDNMIGMGPGIGRQGLCVGTRERNMIYEMKGELGQDLVSRDWGFIRGKMTIFCLPYLQSLSTPSSIIFRARLASATSLHYLPLVSK